jgi:succinate dehydrogenase / fumarate reductase flavoprotein subunit
VEVLKELMDRYKNIAIDDKGEAYNTELVEALELGYLLEVSEADGKVAFRYKPVVLGRFEPKARTY